jgi:hypothetical protein
MLKGLKCWKSEVVAAKIRAIYIADKAMRPEQEQALKTHLQAIAKIPEVLNLDTQLYKPGNFGRV